MPTPLSYNPQGNNGQGVYFDPATSQEYPSSQVYNSGGQYFAAGNQYDPSNGATNQNNPQGTPTGQPPTTPPVDPNDPTAAVNAYLSNVHSHTSSLISSIQAQAEEAKRQQGIINGRTLGTQTVAGYRSGRAQYAPEYQTGLLGATETEGLAALHAIDVKASQLMADAQLASDNQDWAVLSKKMDAWNETQKAKVTAAAKLADDARTANQKIQEQKDQVARETMITQLIPKDSTGSVIQIPKGATLDTAKKIFDTINFDAKGKPAGTTVTYKDIFDVLAKAETPAENTIPGDIGQFQAALSAGLVPQSILSLPKGEQFMAWMNQKDPGKALDLQNKMLDIQKKVKELAASPEVTISNAPKDQQPFLKAMESILASPIYSDKERPQVRQALLTYLADGDLISAKEFLTRAATTSSNAQEQDQAMGRLTATESLRFIQEKLDELRANGADTNLLTGGIEKIAENFHDTSNPKLAYIANQIAQSLQLYRKSMTGVAFGEAEAKEYAKIFPDISDVKDLSDTKIQSLLDTFDRNQKVFLGSKIGNSNYDAIFGSQSSGKTVKVNGNDVKIGDIITPKSGQNVGKKYRVTGENQVVEVQ